MASSNVSPTGDISPNSFADRNIPQWKKELIQRRKNLAKTINAANMTVSPPAAGKLIGSPTKVVKDLATATSPTHTPSTTTGIAGPQTTTTTTPPTPTRHSIPFVGHSHHSTTTSSISTSTAAAAAKSSETSLLLKQQQHQQVAHTNKPMFAPTNDVEKPLHSQSHSNDGGVNSNCGANNASATTSKIINNNNNNITNKKSVIVHKDCGDSANKVPTKCGADSANGKLSKFEQSPKATSDGKCDKPTKKHIEFAINDKMVAADDDVQAMADDGSEELTYGPGIVSKLRCRYLSLALRQSKASRQRPSLNNMRRATSLNNLLDGDDEEDDSVLSDEEDDLDKEKDGHKENGCHRRSVGKTNGNFLNVDDGGEETTDAMNDRNGGGFFQKNRNRTNEKNEYNRYKRGNELSMKRARSVETLLRYENKVWNKSTAGDMPDKEITGPDDDHIESRIINAREHGVAKPKRLTSYIDDDERPPPDVVKQTLKIFEATNNRRSRTANRKIGSEVAAKVATFKSIISLEKPLIAHAKPPLSPKKPNVKPRTTLVAEPSAPVKAYSPNNTIGAPAAANFDNKLSKFNKEKPVLPKLDINIIKNNLESANHNNSSSGGNNNNNNIKCNYQENNNVLLSNKKQQQRTPSPVTVRCDFQTYRNNNNNSYNISRGEAPLSPQNRSESCSPSPVLISTSMRGPPPPPPTQQQQPQTPIRSESPRKFYASLLTNSNFESPFNNLTEKLNNFNLNDTSTPKAAVKTSPSGPPPLPPPRTISAAAAVANHNLMNKLSPTPNSNIGQDPKATNKPPKKDNLNVQPPPRPVDSSSSDFDDDFEESDDHIKRISRTALDNIAKAGLTTEFKFNNSKNNNLCDNKNAKNQALNEKSHLPNGATGRTTPAPPLTIKKEVLNNDGSAHILKQVGVVKPSLYEPQPTKNEFSYNFLDSDDANSRHSPVSSTSSSSSSSFIENGGDIVCAKPVRVGDSNGHSATSDSVEIGHLINSDGGLATAVTSPQPIHTSNKDSNNHSFSNSFNEKPVLTSREIEKNLLNKEKSAVETTTTSVVDSVAATNSVVVGAIVAATVAAPLPVTATNNSVSALNAIKSVGGKKKSWQQPEENNTMVFNFSNRTDVPDYIENAGIMIRRKKELPKPGESGFVLLGDLTLETSTDDLEEDAWTLGPPSPCTVEFPDGGVIINGKSSLRSKPKEAKLKIQFDDSLTSTFEYPSESSLLLEDDPADRSLYGDGIMSNTKLLTSMPMGTNPFASYTPVKASIATHFELGVTRVSPPPMANGQSNNSTTNINNNINGSSSSSSSNNSSLSNNYHINGTTTTATLVSASTLTSASLMGAAANSGVDTITATIVEETDSLQYLKPATDDQTVAWSEGTRATDLLF